GQLVRGIKLYRKRVSRIIMSYKLRLRKEKSPERRLELLAELQVKLSTICGSHSIHLGIDLTRANSLTRNPDALAYLFLWLDLEAKLKDEKDSQTFELEVNFLNNVDSCFDFDQSNDDMALGQSAFTDIEK